MATEYTWRGAFDNAALDTLHAREFGSEPSGADWWGRVNAHSLGWACAHRDDELVGFVNVAWDGGAHAFVLDTVTAPRLQRTGIGTELVRAAARGRGTPDAGGCTWTSRSV